MTQKELNYLDDAVGHEGNIIKILEVSIENLQDENLRSLFQDELSIHQNMKSELVNFLEGKTNE